MASTTTHIRSAELQRRLATTAAITLFALGAAACSHQAATQQAAPGPPAALQTSSAEAEALHGGWEVDINGDRVTLAINKQGTWTYDTGCNDPVSSGTFAIEDGEFVIIEFGMQLETDTCGGTLAAGYERFTAILRDLNSANLDEDLLRLTSAEDSISLSRIS